MRTQGDAVGDAGRGQVGSVDVAGPQAVESAVVQGGEPLRAGGVLEHPLVPRVADRVGLLDGGHRGLLVLDAFGLAGRRGLRGGVLGDGDLRVVQACFQQLERVAVLGAVVFRGLVVDVAASRVADAPLSELGDPVDRVLGELAGREPVAVDVERLHHEVVDVPGGDPRGSQWRFDLLGLQWGGLHAFQHAGHVFEPFRVGLVGAGGLGVLRQFPPLLDLFLAACAERLVVVGACVDDAWRRAVGVVLLPLAQVFGQFAGDAQIHSLRDMSVASRSASRVGSSVPGMRVRAIAPMVVSVQMGRLFASSARQLSNRLERIAVLSAVSIRSVWAILWTNRARSLTGMRRSARIGA